MIMRIIFNIRIESKNSIVDLSSYNIDIITNVKVNGLVTKYHHNTMNKTLAVLHFDNLDSADIIDITYYSVMEERDHKLNQLL